MLLENKQEQIIRTVSQIGNGAHIFAPKEWTNEKVLVIRIERKNIKEEILEMLYPNLDKVISVILFGSHARKEESEDSDVDVLVIAKEKFTIPKKENYDFIVISEKNLQLAIKSNPILMYSAIKEGVPLINQDYAEKLKENKINFKLFSEFIESTKRAIKINKEMIWLDKETGKIASNSTIYSLILRLRGAFIIKSLLKNKIYSNNLFERWITDNCDIEYLEIYNAYRSVRDNKKIKEKIPIKSEEILLDFLKEEIKKLEMLIKSK